MVLLGLSRPTSPDLKEGDSNSLKFLAENYSEASPERKTPCLITTLSKRWNSGHGQHTCKNLSSPLQQKKLDM